ncbi:MAG: helix-turn-helix domain-containing protein, partial [Anaerovoracaceae bacterium]
LPPLRQRKEDLPALIDYFVNKAKKNLGYEKVEMADEVIEFLMEYSYPGNIRELKNMIDRMIVLSDEGYIGVDSITPFQDKHENNSVEETLSTGYSLKDIRKEVEIKYIESILKKNQYNITKSAKELHISTRHLFNKIAEYGIKEPHEKGAEPHEK